MCIRRSTLLACAVLLISAACSTYTKSTYNCDHIRCATVEACSAGGQRESESGNTKDGACYFYNAVHLDPNADEARMGYAFSLLLVGRPDAAIPEFEHVRTYAQNAGIRDAARQYLELLHTKIPASVLYHDALACSSEILRDGELAGKNLYRLVADLGLFEVTNRHPIHIDWRWRCCEQSGDAAIALVLTPACEGFSDERRDLRLGNRVYGQTVTRRYNGAVRIDLYDTRARSQIRSFSARAQTLSVLGTDTTFLSFGKAEASLILEIVRAVLNQK